MRRDKTLWPLLFLWRSCAGLRFPDFPPARHLLTSRVTKDPSVLPCSPERSILEVVNRVPVRPRRMDRGRRAMPVQNKACYERHLKKCHNSHLERLAKMKPTIDCHAPSSMRKVTTKTNAKKQQIMEDRYAQIERDNRLLLEKMSHIMRKGGVDNHNTTSKYAKSLNRGARKKELHKITTENQRILHAIQRADPFYDHIKWAEEAQQNDRYMRNICTMPVLLRDDDGGREGGDADDDDMMYAD